jgi:membrane-associated phospholipid phosphatase
MKPLNILPSADIGTTISSLGPTDRIVLAYALALGAIGVLNGARTSLVVIAMLVVLVIALARTAARAPALAVVHDFAPIAFVLLLYGLTAPIIQVANPRRWDATLAALDHAWFGALPAAWTGLLGRPEWLTATASVLYATFYLIPIAIIVALYRARRRAQFDYFVFTVVATFIVSYIGYLLVPASGPRVAPGDVTALGGAAMDGWLQGFLGQLEHNRFDAFPSGHTALALVYLVLGWRYLPHWRVPLTIAATGIIFSTVYLSLHYVVDVAAGALLAAIMLFAAPALYRLFARGRRARRAFERCAVRED